MGIIKRAARLCGCCQHAPKGMVSTLLWLRLRFFSPAFPPSFRVDNSDSAADVPPKLLAPGVWPRLVLVLLRLSTGLGSLGSCALSALREAAEAADPVVFGVAARAGMLSGTDSSTLVAGFGLPTVGVEGAGVMGGVGIAKGGGVAVRGLGGVGVNGEGGGGVCGLGCEGGVGTRGWVEVGGGDGCGASLENDLTGSASVSSLPSSATDHRLVLDEGRAEPDVCASTGEPSRLELLPRCLSMLDRVMCIEDGSRSAAVPGRANGVTTSLDSQG